MPLFKRVIDREESAEKVLPYEVKPFPAELAPSAKNFIRKQPLEGPGFKIDPQVAEQTGIAESERLHLEERVEQAALEKLKPIQEEAYQQGYQLGLDEGREKAYQESMEKLQASFESWRSFVEELQSFKATLADQHERSLVRLIFLFASKIAQREVSQHPELIAEVVKDCVKRTQEDENVRILLSGSDLEFLKEMAEKIGRDLSFLKKVQLEESADITPGGCIVESNYGQIDATLETRVQKLWELLEPQLPPAKTIIKAS